MRFVRIQPLLRLIENRSLHTPHEHYVKHRIISDEDIRRVVLHVPPRPHLTPIETLKEPRSWPARDKLRITFRACQLRSEPSSRIRRTIAGYWSAAGIAPKIE